MADVELNKEKIEHYIHLVEGALGIELIEEIKSSIAKEKRKGLFSGTREKIHPFASWWSAIQADLLTYSKTKTLSPSSLYFILLALILESLSNVKGIARLLKGLRQSNTFLSTFYEAYVASEYVHSGYVVEVIEECSKENVKTCDLKVSKSTETMFIECKSIDNIAHVETSKWQSFASNVINLLQKENINWKVAIYPSDIVNHDDLESLRAVIRSAVKNNTPSEGSINGKIHYKLFELLDWKERDIHQLFEIDKTLMAQQKFINSVALKGYDSSLSELQNQKNLKPTSYCEVCVAPFESIPRSNTIINAFKTAKKQFPKSALYNIIYINLPSDKGKDFLKCSDESYDSIYHKLNHDSTKIQALILTGMISQMTSRIRPLAFHHFIIPNYNVIQPLSSKLEIIGAKAISNIKGNFNPEMGAAKFEWHPDEGWHSKVSANIFEVISHDGKEQLMVWKTWHDTFRIEHITRAKGRRVAESNVIDFSQIKEDEYLVFLVNWSDEVIDLYLNRKKIAANCSFSSKG